MLMFYPFHRTQVRLLSCLVTLLVEFCSSCWICQSCSTCIIYIYNIFCFELQVLNESQSTQSIGSVVPLAMFTLFLAYCKGFQMYFLILLRPPARGRRKLRLKWAKNPFLSVEGATCGKLGIPPRSKGEEVRAFQLKTCLGKQSYCPPDQDQL